MHIIIVIISLLALLYLAFIYTSESLAMLFFFLLIYAAVTELVFIICRRFIICHMNIPISTVDAGDGAGVETEVSSPGIFLSPRRKLIFLVRNTFTGRSSRIRRKVGGKNGCKMVYPFELTLPEAGNYEITLQSVRFYDRMGLLSFKIKPKGKAQSVQVLPGLRDVPVRISQEVRRFYGESDVYDEEREGTDSSELFGVRPFAEGDKLQKIHWKLSARTDELMVRQDSQPKACAVVVILGYYGGSAGGAGRRHSENRRRKKALRTSGDYLEMAGSISYTLMDQGCPHYVAWFDEKSRDVTRIRVDDEESFYIFLTMYLAGQGSNPPESLITMYREKYKSENYLHSLQLTQEMEIYKDGEIIYGPQDGAWDQMEIFL